MELDQLMRGEKRGNHHNQKRRLDSGSEDGESNWGETARHYEEEWKVSGPDGARPARGCGGSVCTEGERSGGRDESGGRGRGSRGGWDGTYSRCNVDRCRSGAPSHDNLNRGSSSSRGGEGPDRPREPTTWDDAPFSESRPTRDRDLEDLGLTIEEMAFIMSGTVDPASVNAPVAESTEIEDPDNKEQGGSGHFGGRTVRMEMKGTTTRTETWNEAPTDPRDQRR